MLDARVYRAAFVPLLLLVFVAAFSLERRPPAATTVLASDAFSGPRAFATLQGLAAAYPDRRPGSRDEEELGGRIAGTLRASGFEVSRRSGTGRPVGGAEASETVVGVRPGVSSRRIVVVADRTALGSPAAASLSGTAALVELARVFRSREARALTGEPDERRAVGRDLRRTLVLVSTSGANLGGGAPAARAIREGLAGEAGGGIDAVLVLGDLAGAGIRKPWVVPWSDGGRQPPLGLRRTVEAAVRAEVGGAPGGARASAQVARRAFPLTVSAQGELAASGLPAVLLGVSGERGPQAGAPVSEPRLAKFGRAALRAVTAVDGVGVPTAGSDRRAPSDGGPAAFARETSGIVTLRRVLPDWAVRLLVGAALLPALLGALDAFFRVRRRGLPMGHWLGWVAIGGLPLLAGYAWLRVLGLTGALAAPAAPVLPGAVGVGGREWLALASLGLVLAVAVAAARRLARGFSAGSGDAAAGGAAAAAAVTLAVVTALVWVVNPYAAALLVPAAHLWLLAGDPSSRLPTPLAVAAVLGGLLLPVLVVLYYAAALGLGPLGMGWLAVLLSAGGHVTVPAAITGALLLGCAVATATIGVARGRLRRASAAAELDDVRTRGRGQMRGYAGPGSLGGTESALRR